MGVTTYTGVTSLAAKQVCLGPVKRATCTEFVAKSRTTVFSAATFRYVQQPYFLQVWFVGGKIRNIVRFAAMLQNNSLVFAAHFSLL